MTSTTAFAASSTLTALLGLGSFMPLQAQAADSAACTVKHRSERVVVLVCLPQSTRGMLQAAGEAACKDRGSPCNAWIWDDPALAPAYAPAVDTDLPKPVTGAARAVWLHDAGQLMEIKRVR
jgi:hypothetical protein